MSADLNMLERSSVLKGDLLDYANSPALARALRTQLRRQFGKVVAADEGELIEFFDAFMLEHRLHDGRTVLERYLDEHPKLAAGDRVILQGWRDPVQGLFEVVERAGDALVVVNLVDSLTYRVRANAGPQVLQPMEPESFVASRIVPLGDEWLLSGAQRMYPKSARAEVLRAAAQIAFSMPRLAFRNPETLRRGWELQKRDRDWFIEFFGSDTVVLGWAEAAGRLAQYQRFQIDRAVAEAGPKADESHRPPEPTATGWLEDLHEAATIGVVYDQADGMGVYADFQVFLDAFTNPGPEATAAQIKVVRSYLNDEAISPAIFHRMAEEYPEGCDRVFRQLLGRPGFSWRTDGQALLRKHKKDQVDAVPLPRMVPLSETLAAHFTTPER